MSSNGNEEQPMLVDIRGIMEWLGVTRHVAETIMEDIPLVRLGRRKYVRRADVLQLVEERSR